MYTNYNQSINRMCVSGYIDRLIEEACNNEMSVLRKANEVLWVFLGMYPWDLWRMDEQ